MICRIECDVKWHVCTGVTPWLDDDIWKRDKVFSDLASWSYSQLSQQEASKVKQTWADLFAWHKAHPTSDTVVVGQPSKVNDNLEFLTPLLSWGAMWNVLKSYVAQNPLATGDAAGDAVGDAAGATSKEQASKKRKPLDR